jgi:hypothetical protein
LIIRKQLEKQQQARQKEQNKDAITAGNNYNKNSRRLIRQQLKPEQNNKSSRKE